MKFQFQIVAALALASGTAAFCPAPVSQRLATELGVVPPRPRQPFQDLDLGKACMTFVAASVVAVSSSTTILPAQPALAAAAPAVVVETVDLKKLAPEERGKITAKKNLDLSEQTLKEYQKYVASAKAAESKASTALKAQEKVVASAKQAAIADSDKLSAAKNQKMPQTAVKELVTKAGKSHFVWFGTKVCRPMQCPARSMVSSHTFDTFCTCATTSFVSYSSHIQGRSQGRRKEAFRIVQGGQQSGQ